MLTIGIEATSLTDLINKLNESLAGSGYTAVPSAPAPAPAEPAEPAAEEKPKKRRGRPRKTAEPKAEEPAPEPEAAPIVDSPVEPPTPDEVKQALADYNARHGLEAAKQLLSEFGAARFSELDPDKYQEFIAKAKG